LRASQVIDRLTRRFRSAESAARRAGTGHRLRPRPPVPPLGPRREKVTAEGFRFLGEARPFAGEDRWRPQGASRLWTYQLHYFQALFDLDESRAGSLVCDWLDTNPPGSAPGWEPYPISLRVREWIEWLLHAPAVPEDLRQRATDSLAAQACVLEALLERHLGGNHLLENAITLCWVGASLRGPRSAGWLKRGGTLLRELLAEQVLSDGTHDERSPMYQSLIAEALLRLSRVLAATGNESLALEVRTVAERLVTSLGHLVHPDGDFALMSDCALGEAPQWPDLARAASGAVTPPRPGPWELPQGGYLGWRDGAGAYLVLDTGPIGPDHQPGHGHADMLSFELSHRGERLVTDTGVVRYDEGEERAYDRSTAAHSTVEVDGRSQSELWGAFRCARRARVTEGSVAPAASGGALLVGRYRDPWGVRHRRRLSVARGRIEGEDLVEARGLHHACLRFHFAPGVEARARGESADLLRDGGQVATLRAPGQVLVRETTPYHPSFGETVERACLALRASFVSQWRIVWTMDLL